MSDFLPGIALNWAYYAEAVRPILDVRFPDLAYAAALIGYGSDVLDYDTPRSTDLLMRPEVFGRLRALYVAEEAGPALPER